MGCNGGGTMIEYFIKYPHKIIGPFLEHIQITMLVLLCSIPIALCITVLIMRNKILANAIIGFFSAIYCIPSLAIFALCIPLFGLGQQTVIIVLIVYNQFYLVRTFLAAIREVDPFVCEASKGCGLSTIQSLWYIQLPLAFPTMIGGIRVAAISTISIATIGASINGGGLGTILFEGMRTRNTGKILWGVILTVVLNIVTSKMLLLIETRTRNRIHI